MQQPMTGASLQGRLINESRELLAFGDCELHAGGDITMRVAEEHATRPHRTPGPLMLVLDDGRALNVSNRFVRLQLRGGAHAAATTIYRLHTLRN